MLKIALPEKGVILQAETGSNLWEILAGSGEVITAGCGGRGRCGQCRVAIKRASGLEVVNACRYYVEESITVHLQDSHRSEISWRIHSAPHDDSLYLGIDIGTTTIGLYLAAEDGSLIADCGITNPQVTTGAEVMSRLMAVEDDAIRHAMAQSMRKAVSNRIGALRSDVKVEIEQIQKAVIVCNGAMAILALGIHPGSLSRSPYKNPLSGRGLIPVVPEEWGLAHETELYLAAPEESFLGSDAVLGAAARGFNTGDTPAVYMDIGTNGEILLASRGKIWGTSTAAGPAFEGGYINCGMSACKGAIDRVYLDTEGKIQISTRGNSAPIGICGSGLLSAVQVLLDTNVLDSSGSLDREHNFSSHFGDVLHCYLHKEESGKGGIFLSQLDIRQLQLAKAAIGAGLEILTGFAGIKPADISRICVTGAFGVHCEAGVFHRVGIIPPDSEVEFIPDGAGRGALHKAINMGRSSSKTPDVNYINLAEQPDFEEIFIRHMILDPDAWKKGLVTNPDQVQAHSDNSDA